MKRSPLALIVLDGFGYHPHTEHNAIAQAHTPCIDTLFIRYPHTTLAAAEGAVGLPKGVIGNSEVGHTTLGAGRVITQPLTHINNAVADNSLSQHPTLLKHCSDLAQRNGTVHLMGLASDAGVHSTLSHLEHYMKAAHTCGVKKIVVHAFLDGRDVPPCSARTYLEALEQTCQTYGAHIGSVHGRFYAMDRDTNWDRTQQTYAVLTSPEQPIQPWKDVLEHHYKHNSSDEYVAPTACAAGSTIHDGDGVIFFNFRSDRARQLTHLLRNGWEKQTCNLLWLITPVAYCKDLPTTVLFEAQPIEPTLIQTLSDNKLNCLAIAETEKYAHVTYFFNGGREEPLPHESRMLIPSLKKKSYAQAPHMSAPEITQGTLHALEHGQHDFYLINYANADMVGHTGNIDATVQAIECLDTQVQTLYTQFVEKRGGTLCITADHGNAEHMFDRETHQPRTAHTTNPVPFIAAGNRYLATTLPMTQLADVAPFILRHYGIAVPPHMQRPS